MTGFLRAGTARTVSSPFDERFAEVFEGDLAPIATRLDTYRNEVDAGLEALLKILVSRLGRLRILRWLQHL